MEEISQLPKYVQDAAKHYFGIVTRHQVYIRIYSTIAEITPDKFYPPINLIKFGTTKKPLEQEEEEKEDIDEEEDYEYKLHNL